MSFDITTLYVIISVIFLIGFLSKKGRFLSMLRNNTDIYGKNHSWKKTIVGLIVFILSVPLILFFAFYAAEQRAENMFALAAFVFFVAVMILQLKNMIKDRKTKKRLWEK